MRRHFASKLPAIAAVVTATLCALMMPTAWAGNLLENPSFDSDIPLPWQAYYHAPDGAAGTLAVVGGELCATATAPGIASWQVQVRQQQLALQRGHTYSVRFTAHASAPTSIRLKVGMAGPPYTEYWNLENVALTTQPQTFTGSFTMAAADDPTVEYAFHFGGPLATAATPFTVCFDNLALDDPEFNPTPPPPPLPKPSVRVNQVGYYVHAVKRATIVSACTDPIEWKLVDGKGALVAKGSTRVFGRDKASGDHVHIADFSRYNLPGSGYTLVAANSTSHPFDIGNDIYSTLFYDALAYFYHNRSGIELVLPYAGQAKWARPAGHLPDIVTCGPDTGGCDYFLDVTGGWYDAGDHGKYVVNGGISVWTLMNIYERGESFEHASNSRVADGKLNIPENNNSVPDLLDEARWEMEFLLKMQVPDGKPLAGMAHHKMHDESWTGLGLAPHEDPRVRYLRPPSTAATLNLAATAAQCARIWKKIDKAFSRRCRVAAEKAWQAALANPTRYAPASDTNGGGPYSDGYVVDDFYWAAAELYVTTGSSKPGLL